MSATTKEEKTLTKDRIRKNLPADLPSYEDAAIEAEKEMAIRREIGLSMMLDLVSDERIHHYTKLPYIEIEYIRIALLPKAIRDSECKSRAMNESLIESMRSVRRYR